MNRSFNKLTAMLLMMSIPAFWACRGNQQAPAANANSAASTPADAPAAQQTAAANFSESELDELLAPIALYPDPLLAQMIPAATFTDQIDAAARLLGGKVENDLIDQQDWDVSVKAVAHYPEILEEMTQNPDWTTALGQAYVNQPKDVRDSIQRLRGQANDAGTLVTTPQQEVITEGEYIEIKPAQPQVIYVPQYDPEVVYVEQDSGVSTGTAVAIAALTFGAGLAIGAWLNRDYDWDDDIYYHGWTGGGWVGYNRAYVDVDRSIYVNNSYRNINVHRNVVNRDIRNYRADVDRRASVRRERDIERNRRAKDTGVDRTRDRSRDRAGDHRARQARDHQPNARARSGSGHALGGGSGKARAEHNRAREPQRTGHSGGSGGSFAGSHDRSRGSAGKSARSGGGSRKSASSRSGGGKSRSGGGGGGHGGRR
jgi:hypothetical protein